MNLERENLDLKWDIKFLQNELNRYRMLSKGLLLAALLLLCAATIDPELPGRDEFYIFGTFVTIVLGLAVVGFWIEEFAKYIRKGK